MWSCGLSGPGGLAQFRHTDSGTGLLAAGTGSGSAKGLRISGLVGNASMTRPPPAANPRMTAIPEPLSASRPAPPALSFNMSRRVNRASHSGSMLEHPPKKLGSVWTRAALGGRTRQSECVASPPRASRRGPEFEVSESTEEMYLRPGPGQPLDRRTSVRPVPRRSNRVACPVRREPGRQFEPTEPRTWFGAASDREQEPLMKALAGWPTRE